MRILLDTKDLINVVEKNTPVSLSELGEFLVRKNAKLALTYINIREFVSPASRGGDFLPVRRQLQMIEALPICYLREAPVVAQEILASIEAFSRNVEPSPVDPYVRRWDYTFSYPGPSAAEIFVGYRLDEIVYELLRRDPKLFEPYRFYGEKLREQFAAERGLPTGAKKSPTANFPDSVRKHGLQWGVQFGSTDVNALGSWVYRRPLRCPGLRLSYDVYHEISANVGDKPKDSDIPDVSHFYPLPYVDAATIDRRMMSYFRAVVRRLKKAEPKVTYDKYTFRGVLDLLSGLP